MIRYTSNKQQKIEEFKTDFEMTLDPRVDWTLARRGIPYLDWGVNEGYSWIRDAGEGHMMMKKWMQYSWEPAHSTNAQNARNYRAYRYAHVLLWRAEVAIEDEDLNYARELVNMVRLRAQSDIPMGLCETTVFDGSPIVVNENEASANYLVNPYPVDAVAFSSATEARKAVRLEQRLEFALEGNRFFDLRRWGIDKEKLDYFVQSEQEYIKDMVGKSYDPELDDYLPIPLDQIDIQQGVLVQDPAYN